MSTDDEDARPGTRILLACLGGLLVTAAAVVAELALGALGGPWRYPCAAVTAAAPLLLVRPAVGPVRAWFARRRTARARRSADSLRLEQMHERSLRRPTPRRAAVVLDDADTRSFDLDAIRH